MAHSHWTDPLVILTPVTSLRPVCVSSGSPCNDMLFHLSDTGTHHQRILSVMMHIAFAGINSMLYKRHVMTHHLTGLTLNPS
eukprot:IDg16257t1